MALARPPMFDCGFAALGPQLRQLATAVDNEALDMQTPQIFTGLSVQSAVIARQLGVIYPVAANNSITPVIWDAEDYRFGTDIGFIGNVNPVAIQNDADPLHRHWFYLGWYVRTAGSGNAIAWHLRTEIDDTDPVTHLSTQRVFEKSFINTPGGTGEELLWMEMFVPNSAGNIATWIAQSSGAPINIGSGRFWIMQLSTKR